MTPGDRIALEALHRRLSHTEAIAGMIGKQEDTQLGESIRGIEMLLSDCGYQLERILDTAAEAQSA